MDQINSFIEWIKNIQATQIVDYAINDFQKRGFTTTVDTHYRLNIYTFAIKVLHGIFYIQYHTLALDATSIIEHVKLLSQSFFQ